MKIAIKRVFQIGLVIAAVVMMAATAGATTYYVDPAGSNGNDGLTPQTPWRTLLKVGISTFLPGDEILFKRDGVWNEWLTPPSSGTAGNLIKFDAYGSGRPPEFTGLYQTKNSDWTNTTGNVWQITLSATQPITQLKFVRFGTIWGNAQTAQANLGHDRDWFYDATSQILYVWSASGNPVTVTLSWSPPSSGPTPDWYNVYRSSVSGGPYTLIASEVTSTTYTDRAVNPQQEWFYVTTSVSAGVESAFSNETSATVPGNWVYVYPGSYEDPSTEALAVTAGYGGARGSGSMQPSPNAATITATGINRIF